MRNRRLPKLSPALLTAGIILAGLLPIARMVSILLGTGMNNLSDDYLHFAPVVVDILHHGLSFQTIPDTCFRGQCETLTFVLMALIARYFAWNTFAEMIFAMVVFSASVILITLAFTGPTLSPKKLWVFIFVSAFSLSVSQIASFTFGQTAICTATTLFGLSLALFAYRFFPNSYRGILLIGIGMLICAASYGAGAMAVPIVLVFVLFRFRQPRFIAIWLGALLLSSAPYLIYFFHGQSGASQIRASLVGLFRPSYIINLLGMFFSNNIGVNPSDVPEFIPSLPNLVGKLGILAVLTFALYLLRKGRLAALDRHLPALGLIAFGVGSIWQISVFRPGVAPWYIVSTTPFWLGLIGLYFSLLTSAPPGRKALDVPLKALAGIFFLGVGILWVHSNLTYEDKLFHLVTRSPASTACLRYAQEAPTYCEGLLFQWGLGSVEEIQNLAAPLAENQLSVFGPQQVKTLQGEFAFDDKVSLAGAPSAISWWTGLDGKVARWDDYHFLDALIPAPLSVTWTVDIPANTRQATFTTGVGISAHYQPGAPAAGDQAGFSIVIQAEGMPQKVVFAGALSPLARGWIPVTASLDAYRGKRVTIHFTSTGTGPAGQWTMVQFPKVELSLQPGPAVEKPQAIYAPVNTDLAENSPVQTAQPNDVLFPERTALIGRGTDAPPLPLGPGAWQLSEESNFQFQTPVDVCLAGYSHVSIALSLSSAVTPRYVHVLATLDGSSKRELDIPLLPDGDMHTYTYPLRLLQLSPNQRLTNLQIFFPPNSAPDAEVQFQQIQLIHNPFLDGPSANCGMASP